MTRFKLYEAPAFTAIEEIATGELLCSIHTRKREGDHWVFLTREEIEARKARVLQIFEKSANE